MKYAGNRKNTNDKGSVMVIVLLVLVLLTIGGISAIHLSVMEFYIVRNSAFYKQNLYLAEMAALEGLQEILGRSEAAELLPGAEPWIWDLEDWNKAAYESIPDHGYAIPLVVAEKTAHSIRRRGESEDETLRYYFAGWKDVHGDSVAITQAPKWRTGKVIGVYDSLRYGRLWVEIGVRKKF